MLSSSEAAAGPGAPPPLPDRQQQQQQLQHLAESRAYELRVIQQPLRARMCGFGEKLVVRDRGTGQPVDAVLVDASFFTVSCALFSADMGSEMDLIQQRAPGDPADPGAGDAAGPDPALAPGAAASIMSFSAGPGDSAPSCVVRNLIGATVATGAKLQGLHGEQGIFFVFPDLSIRKDGEYRLRFTFFDLRGENGELLTTSTRVLARVFSDPFRVYSAKQFPGMIESTTLSKHFARQGVKIPVRKESAKSGPGTDADTVDL